MAKSIINHVSDVYLEEHKSKSGHLYQMLVVEFDDGYRFMKPAFGDTEYILKKYIES